jgi:hypothetical protein
MALADADATGNFIRWEASAKNESDPEKLTTLTQQVPEFVSRAAAGISDPEIRTLWAARTQERVARAQALAQTKQLGIWQDRWEAGVLQKADDLVQLAARSDDPAHQHAAGESLGQLLANLEPIHGKTKTDALIKKSQEKIAIERFAWLSSNNRAVEANKFLDDVAPILDPTTLNRLRSGIKPELTQELGRGLEERTRGAPDSRGHLNYGRTGALGDPTKPGWDAENITAVSAPSGAKFRVHKQAAADIEGFLKELEATGYKVDAKESGGHNVRQITGGTGLSEHAFGTAIDINPSRNPYSKEGKKITDLPQNVAELADKYNLEWGGNWKSPVDTMHFQWRGPRTDSAIASVTATPQDTVIPKAISAEASRAGVDPKMALTVAQLESSMGANTGSRGNIFQLGDPEWASAGGGAKGDTATDVRNGVKHLRSVKDDLEQRLKRKVEPWEIYMAHQQGVEGASNILLNPDKLAGQVTDPEYIRKNGGNPEGLAADFADKWRGKYLETAAQVGGGPTRLAQSDPATMTDAAPARPDWKGQIDRIQASDAPEDVKNAAVGRVEKNKRQFEFEQSEANNDILLRATREETTESEIDDLHRQGKISPEARRQSIGALDRITEQRAKAEAKLEEERITVSRLMHRAASAGAGGPALDPKSKDDRLGLNLHYAQESAAWRPEEAIPNAVAYSARYGLVPDGLQKMIRGGLHSGRPDQAVLAAQTIEQLRTANPQLVGEIGDEKDLRFGELILSNNRKGMEPTIAVQRAVESLKVDKTTREAREAAYDDERGKDRTIRERNDRRWLEGKKDTWGSDPSADPVMMAEFGELAKSEYIATGDLDAARSRAMDTISRVWGRTRVGGGGERYSKFAPEKFYGVPTLSEGENADWMNEQLIGEISTGAMTGAPVTPDRLLLAPSDKPAPDGRPAYEIFLKDQQGVFNRVFRWAPNWEASAEYRRRQEGRQRTLGEMRALRRGEAPSVPNPLKQSDEAVR